MTMVSWLIDTSRPRIAAGATSAMYMGERLDAIPMATPPSIRQETKSVKLGAQALPNDVAANRTAHHTSNRRRPKRSLSAPARSAPTQTSQQCATVRPPLRKRLGKAEVSFEERLSAADDDPIVAEEQSAQCGRQAGQPDIPQVVARIVLHGLLSKSTARAPRYNMMLRSGKKGEYFSADRGWGAVARFLRGRCMYNGNPVR